MSAFLYISNQGAQKFLKLLMPVKYQLDSAISDFNNEIKIIYGPKIFGQNKNQFRTSIQSLPCRSRFDTPIEHMVSDNNPQKYKFKFFLFQKLLIKIFVCFINSRPCRHYFGKQIIILVNIILVNIILVNKS